MLAGGEERPDEHAQLEKAGLRQREVRQRDAEDECVIIGIITHGHCEADQD